MLTKPSGPTDCSTPQANGRATTYRELLERLKHLDESQLDQQACVQTDDDWSCGLWGVHVLDDDIVWSHGEDGDIDYLMPMQDAKKEFPDEYADWTIASKTGSVFIVCDY